MPEWKCWRFSAPADPLQAALRLAPLNIPVFVLKFKRERYSKAARGAILKRLERKLDHRPDGPQITFPLLYRAQADTESRPELRLGQTERLSPAAEFSSIHGR